MMHSFGLPLREETIGALRPPEGVTPNFIDPPSIKHVILITNSVFPVVSALFLAFRLYTTGFITRSVGMDDYTIALAWILACASSIVDSLLTRYGLGLHLWDVPYSTYHDNFLKLAVICAIFYGLSIMFSKLSLLVLFLRYMPQKPTMTIYATMVVVVLYSLVGSFGWLFSCRFIEKFWDPRLTHGSCIEWKQLQIFTGVMNTITDAFILLLPIYLLRRVRLPKWEKIGLSVVLMAGGFVLVLSIVRLKTTADMESNPDITWEYVRNGIWWMIEMHIAVVCGCLPIGRAFLRKHTRIIGYNFNTLGNA